MDNNALNLRKKTVLVTGATGFIGRHLVTRLINMGWEVHVVVREASHLPDSPMLSLLVKHTHDGTTDGMVRLVSEAKPDVVCHLASVFVAQHAPKDVAPLVVSNILFGSQLLEAMRVNGVTKFVNTGTSWQHFENRDYCPVCLYAATKQAFQAMVDYYVDACNYKVITLKLFDTYGPDDLRPKLFSLLKNTTNTEEVLVMSPGEQRIDLVYIDDVIDAYLIAVEKLMENKVVSQESYALSSGCAISLKELVAIWEEVADRKLPIQWGGRHYREREVMIPWNTGIPISGFEPKVSLHEGIARILPNLV